MKTPLLLGSLLLLAVSAQAQNKIGTNPATIDAASILELEASDKALYLTRVSLDSTTDVTTVPMPKAGMVVYNTNTVIAGTLANPVLAGGKGIYCYDGTRWVGAGARTPAWNLNGNSGTTETNFLGTLDNVPLYFRVSNEPCGRIDPDQVSAYYGYRSGASGTGNSNVGMGTRTLEANTTGVYNTGIGKGALSVNTTGISNTALGGDALTSNVTSSRNVALGSLSLYQNIIGYDNTAGGANSMPNNLTGGSNTSFGSSSMFENTSGGNNVASGYYALATNRSGAFNTAIGSGADVTDTNLYNAAAFGAGAIVNATDKVRIGNADVTVIEGQVAYSYPSDARFKYNVQSKVPGLAFIQKLRPITYRFDTRKFNAFLKTGELQSTKENAAAPVQTGFLAQEVEDAARELNYTFDGVHAPTGPHDNYSVSYSQFVVPLVKAVQELSQKVEVLEAENTRLRASESALAELARKVAELEKQMGTPVAHH